MANNYYYIVGGFPDLLLDFEGKHFDSTQLREEVKGGLSASDQRLVEWLYWGTEAKKLSSHFYRAAFKVKNAFIRDYYQFDLQLRNVLSALSARKAGRDPGTALIGNDPINETLSTSKAPDFGLREELPMGVRLFSILEGENILEREMQLDRLRWEKADEICDNHYFDLDVILNFLLKVSIIERWMRLEKSKGEALFKTLVQEIQDSKTVRQ